MNDFVVSANLLKITKCLPNVSLFKKRFNCVFWRLVKRLAINF